MRGAIKDLSLGMDGSINVMLSLPKAFLPGIRKLQGNDVEVDIKKYRPRRSLNANALLWKICGCIAEAFETPHTDVDIYREAIRCAGVCYPVPVRSDAVSAFCIRWETQGLGWFADIIDNSKLDGYKLVKIYLGSSTYDTKEMSRLIDWLLQEARTLDVRLPATEREIEEAKRRWGVKEEVSA